MRGNPSTHGHLKEKASETKGNPTPAFRATSTTQPHHLSLEFHTPTSSSMKSSGPRTDLSALLCREDTKVEGVHPRKKRVQNFTVLENIWVYN
jgi:hypothetical protein